MLRMENVNVNVKLGNEIRKTYCLSCRERGTKKENLNLVYVLASHEFLVAD